MRLGAILSEAWRGLATGTARASTLAVTLAALCTGLATLDVLSVVGLERRAAAYREAGADVVTLVAPGQVDAAGCDALAGSGPVDSAGSIVPADPVRLLAAPGYEMTTYAASTGFAAVLGVPDPDPMGVWLSDRLAAALEVVPGDVLVTAAGAVPVAAVFPWPADGRDARLDLAVLVPVAATVPHDECWVRTSPPLGVTEDVEALVRTAAHVTGAVGDPVQVAQANRSLGGTFDGAADLAHRPTRFAGAGCAVVGLLLGLVAVRARRLEHAGALHAGQTRAARAAVVLVEAAVWAGVGAAVSGVVLLVLVGRSGTDAVGDLLLLALRGPALGAAAAVLGTLAGVVTVREAHLFRYFKDR